MSEPFLDEEQIRCRRGDIGLSHAPAVKCARIKSGSPFLDGRLLIRTAVVPRVHRHDHYSARCQQTQGLLQGDAGCVRAGDDAAISSRQVAEIEQHNLQWHCDVLCYLFVPDRQERHLARQICFSQSAAGFFNRLPLDVKTPDMASNSDQTCQQQGVMSVAAGRINRVIPVTYKTVQEQMRKRHRSAQRRYGG